MTVAFGILSGKFLLGSLILKTHVLIAYLLQVLRSTYSPFGVH